MKWIVSRYNHDISYLREYTDDVEMYDRSEVPLGMDGADIYPVNCLHIVPNIGTDIYDKFTYIIDNYDNLPDVAVYTKANIFKYITKEEFDVIKDNTTFTPILTQYHAETVCDYGMPKPGIPYSFYYDKMYYEINHPSFLNVHKTKNPYYCFLDTFKEHPLFELLKIKDLDYIPFAPGSNYILPKENILKHPKEFYEKLRSYLDWDIYPGEAMIIERGLYTLWG